MDSNSARKRSRRAYRVAYRIVGSYLFLFIRKRIMRKERYEAKLLSLHQKNAVRLKEAILELKGLFTKVGQLLSVMSTILPDAYAVVLESLQDKAPPSDFIETEKTITQELGRQLDELFAEFDVTPIASASIGQVYKARLKTGEVVAVKVQHHDIEALAQLDLAIIETLIKRFSFFFRVKGIENVYQQVRLMVEEELDYVLEAQSMVRIGGQLNRFSNVIVPQLFPTYSTSKMIVCAFHEGVKITNIEQLEAWQIDRQEIADRLITIFCKLILDDGFYHADPHPGNVLINASGDIILLDFGATAELNEAMRREIPVLVQHIIRKDTPKILRSLQKMGFLGNDNDTREVAGKLVDALTNFVQNEIKMDNLNIKDVSFDDIKGSSLDNLRKEIGIRELAQTLEVPKDWVLLERAILLLHGISATIAPDYNPMDTVKPYLKKVVLSDGGLKSIILDTIKQEFTALIQLPSALSLFFNKANTGKLEVQTRNRDAKRFYALGQQLMLVLVIFGFLILDALRPNDFYRYAALTAAVFLFFSIRKNRPKRW